MKDTVEMDGGTEMKESSQQHSCQMAIAKFLYPMCLALQASRTMATLQNVIPFFPIGLCPLPSALAQSKERKGSNFAIWQPWSIFAAE